MAIKDMVKPEIANANQKRIFLLVIISIINQQLARIAPNIANIKNDSIFVILINLSYQLY